MKFIKKMWLTFVAILCPRNCAIITYKDWSSDIFQLRNNHNSIRELGNSLCADDKKLLFALAELMPPASVLLRGPGKIDKCCIDVWDPNLINWVHAHYFVRDKNNITTDMPVVCDEVVSLGIKKYTEKDSRP